MTEEEKRIRKNKWSLEYYYRNKEKVALRMKKYRENNKEKVAEMKKKWHEKNKVSVNKRHNEYFTNRLKTDPYFKFAHSLRSRLRIAIKNKYKTGSAVRDLGCSGEEAYKYIASKFTDGMNWNNFGKWHIDHIKPLSSFNLEDRDQFLEAVHYTNLQPLWADENHRKYNKVESYSNPCRI